MVWTALTHTKKTVRRAGEYLSASASNTNHDLLQYSEAYAVLDNWRTSHAYPIQSMLGYFRNKAFEIDKNAVIVQRLKRTPSILTKLKREQGMMLDRMEDIGGCRIVVSNVKDVYKVRDGIVNGRTRNRLKRERDYIKSPKQSGYRGIHLIYSYQGKKSEYIGHAVELQIRSQIQHSWATAVEVVGTFTGEALKASQGQQDWLDFFRLASKAFEDIENKRLQKNKNEQHIVNLSELITNLDVLEKLKAFAVSANHLRQQKRGYFLLILDTSASTISISRYEQIDVATKAYAEAESSLLENEPEKDVVLVSAESINALKKAYPNYFADTRNFTKNLERVLNMQSK